MKVANYRPLPLILISLVAGIISAAFYNVVAFIIAVMILFTILLLTYNKKFKVIGIICSVFLLIGLITTTLTIYLARDKTYDNALISGRVGENIIYDDNDKIHIIIDNLYINERKVRGKASVTLNSEDISYYIIETGDNISFMANVKRNKLDPYDSYSAYSFRSGLYYTADIISIENRSEGRLRVNERIKLRIYNIIFSSVHDEQSKGMAYAFLIGSREYMSQDMKYIVTSSGIAHIFAVSGMHIGILAGAVFYLLRSFKVNIKYNIIATTIVLLIYAYICGFPPSVNRAVLMCVMVMYGRVIGRRNDLLSIISLSAIILLIVNPINLFNLSFMLSYGAVFGIVLLYKPIARVLNFVPEFAKPIITTSLSTNIAILPIMTGYFNSLSLYFLITNVIVLPFVAFAYVVLIIGVLIAVIIPPITFIVTFSGYFFTAIRMILELISSLPFAVISIGSMGVFVIFYYFTIIITSDYILLDKKFTNKALLICLIGSFSGLVIALATLH